MRFRKLRIAFSAACLVACVLLIVLWVRSYWWCDVAERTFTSSSGFRVASKSGYVSFSKYSPSKVEWDSRNTVMAELQTRS